MNTIRLVINDELRQVLDYMHVSQYPTLTYAEMTKVALSNEAVRIKRAKKISTYNDSDPTPKEMMLNTAKIWSLDEDGDEEPFWDESKLKPVKF